MKMRDLPAQSGLEAAHIHRQRGAVQPVRQCGGALLLARRGNTLKVRPFAGSGTTGQAAVLEGVYPIMIEMEADYVEDIENRMKDVAGESETEMPQDEQNVAPLDSLFVD